MSEKSQKIIAEFMRFKNWEQKYLHLIELGKRLPAMPAEKKTEDVKVKGCQSQVWLAAELTPDGKVAFTADSDALIVKGLIALLVQFFSHETPDDILAAQPDFIQTIGLAQHLTPSRANGLGAMVKQIKYYAAAFKALQEMQQR